MQLFSWYPDNLSDFRNWSRSHPFVAANTSFPTAFRSVRLSAAVADLVEAIWDWDISDDDAAAAFTIKVPPSTAPYFVVQYRTLTHCRWQLGGDSYDHKNYGDVLTQTQSGTFAISPRGPLGVITVRLKPEAASRLARAHMPAALLVRRS